MRLKAYSPRKRQRIGVPYRSPRWIRYALFVLATVLLCLAIAMLINYMAQGKAARETQMNLQDELRRASLMTVQILDTELTQAPTVQMTEEAAIVSFEPRSLPTAGAAMLPKFVSLFGKNSDLAGWLKSDAIYDIDFPIVRRDNTFYLDKDFYGQINLAGTVFMDEGNSILPQDQNLILHGHNMKNGTMFGKLTRLMDISALLAAPFFSFSTLYMEMIFVPYAVSLVSIDPANARYFDFNQQRFSDENTLAAYVQRLKETSVLQVPVSVDPGDLLLTLVTCHGNEVSERLIIGLRALRPDESRATVQKLLMEQTGVK